MQVCPEHHPRSYTERSIMSRPPVTCTWCVVSTAGCRSIRGVGVVAEVSSGGRLVLAVSNHCATASTLSTSRPSLSSSASCIRTLALQLSALSVEVSRRVRLDVTVRLRLGHLVLNNPTQNQNSCLCVFVYPGVIKPRTHKY